MRATWYVTETGETVDPAECNRTDGVLTHSSGAKIAMRFADCPRSRGVDVDAAGKLLFGGKGDHDTNGTTGGAKEPVAEPAPAADAAAPAAVETTAEAAPAPKAEIPAKKTEDMNPASTAKPHGKRHGYKTRGK